MTELGGFFASLKLKTDTASFAQGKKNLDEMSKSTKGMRQEYNKSSEDVIEKTMKMGQAFVGLAAAVSKMGLALGTALTAAAVSSANSARQISQQADKAGLSKTQAINAGTTAAITGGNSEALLSEMAGWQKTLFAVSRGDATAYSELIKSLSFMGLSAEGIKAFANKNKQGNTSDLLKALLAAADKSKDFNTTYQNLLSFAPETAAIYQRAHELGKPSLEIYKEASAINMRTEAGQKVSNLADYEYLKMGAEFNTLMGLLGDNINKVLLPYLKDINKWFIENKDTMAAMAKTIADVFGTILKGLSDFVNSPVVKSFGNFVVNTGEFVGNTITNAGTAWDQAIIKDKAWNALKTTNAELPWTSWETNKNLETAQKAIASGQSEIIIKLDVDPSTGIRMKDFKLTLTKDQLGRETWKAVELGASR